MFLWGKEKKKDPRKKDAAQKKWNKPKKMTGKKRGMELEKKRREKKKAGLIKDTKDVDHRKKMDSERFTNKKL